MSLEFFKGNRFEVSQVQNKKLPSKVNLMCKCYLCLLSTEETITRHILKFFITSNNTGVIVPDGPCYIKALAKMRNETALSIFLLLNSFGLYSYSIYQIKTVFFNNSSVDNSIPAHEVAVDTVGQNRKNQKTNNKTRNNVINILPPASICPEIRSLFLSKTFKTLYSSRQLLIL